MTQQHPITPPSELLQLWFEQHDDYNKGINELLIEAAQYGADQELKASVSWLVENQNPRWADALYVARRPKPSSLKEQALEMLESAWEGGHINNNAAQTIRRALEALPDD